MALCDNDQAHDLARAQAAVQEHVRLFVCAFVVQKVGLQLAATVLPYVCVFCCAEVGLQLAATMLPYIHRRAITTAKQPSTSSHQYFIWSHCVLQLRHMCERVWRNSQTLVLFEQGSQYKVGQISHDGLLPLG